MKKKSGILFVLATSWLLSSCMSPEQSRPALGSITLSTSRGRKSANVVKHDTHRYHLDVGKAYADLVGDDFESLKDGTQSLKCHYSTREEGGVEREESRQYKTDGLIGTRSQSDSYENNDSFQEATSIYAAGVDANGVYWHSVWLYATISQKTTGWWLWEQNYIDKDFYSFDMVSVGTLTIDLTEIPTGCDYDLRLFKLSNNGATSFSELDFNNPNHVLAQSISGGVGGDERIQITNATPGTYYIVVYSYQDLSFDNENTYKLTVQEQVDTQRENTSYSIPLGRNSGDLFALWQSDYDPLGLSPLSMNPQNTRFQFTNYESYPMIRHLADTYTNGVHCNYAVLYVWDVAVRECLYSYFNALLQSLNGQFFDAYGNEINFGENEQNNFQIIWDSVGLAVSIAGVVGCFVAPVGWAAAAVGLAMSIYSFIHTLSQEEFVLTKRQLRDYLINITAALETGVGSNNNEVIMIRFQYRFYTENGNRYLDWSPIYDPSHGNRYNSDLIQWQINGSGTDGTVRGFADQSQIDLFLGLGSC